MFIELDEINIHVSEFRNLPNKRFIFLFHGFAGSSEDWLEIWPYLSEDFNIIAVDFPGHGKSDSPILIEHYLQENLVAIIDKVIAHYTNKEVTLVGYSMGGRAALSYAIRYPERIHKLIMESSTAGIYNILEKEARIKKDNELADFIINNDIDTFAEFWVNLPMFNSLRQDKNKFELNYKSKLNNSKEGLSKSLRGFSTGRMENLFPYLHKITYPVLLIAGEHDAKFKKINSEMNGLIKGSQFEVLEAGHNVHLEAADKFISVINKFLKE